MRELTLQEIQQGSFQVLLKFKEICEQNNLKYFLAYGTLIGAIRHKGFIPWDDDIDVWMPRPDYERFIQYCIDHESELRNFVLKHYKTCKEYIYPIARFVDARYKIEYMNAKDYGLGLFIDIYPLDGVIAGNKKQIRTRNNYMRKISVLGANHYIKSPNWFKNIFKYVYYETHKNKDLNKFIATCDKFAQKCDYDMFSHVGCVVWGPPECLDKRDFESEQRVYFNGEVFNAPIGYDHILTELFGDYMTPPPESERIAHHFYKAYLIV